MRLEIDTTQGGYVSGMVVAEFNVQSGGENAKAFGRTFDSRLPRCRTASFYPLRFAGDLLVCSIKSGQHALNWPLTHLPSLNSL
jgi:hypothetical protein